MPEHSNPTVSTPDTQSDEECKKNWGLQGAQKEDLPDIKKENLNAIATKIGEARGKEPLLHKRLVKGPDQVRLFGNGQKPKGDAVGVIVQAFKDNPGAFRKERDMGKFVVLTEVVRSADGAQSMASVLADDLGATRDAYQWQMQTQMKAIGEELREDAENGNLQAAQVYAVLERIAQQTADQTKTRQNQLRSATAEAEDKAEEAETHYRQSVELIESLRKENQELRHMLALRGDNRSATR